MLENKANAKINKHKAEDLLKALKTAVGTEMYNKIFYHLQNSVEDGVTHDISLSSPASGKSSSQPARTP